MDPKEEEQQPSTELHFATIGRAMFRFFCHGKQMEVFHDDDHSFHVTCDLCGKSIRGEVAAP